MHLSGQRLLVVGGSSGMGKAIAKRAVAAEMEVIIAGRGGDSLTEAVAELGPVQGEAVDIASEGEIRRLADKVGAVDHLVTSAAFVRPGPFRGSDTQDARTCFEGKFWSQYLLAKHVQVNRSILFFSGAYSRRPAPGVVAIAAVNAAIEALAKGLARELAPLRVNVLSPGLIQGTSAYLGMPAERRQQMYDGAAQALPAGLVGDADSVAGLALALLESPYATGAVVDVDGGGLLV